MRNFCSRCGAPLHQNEKFCPKCGSAVLRESSAAPTNSVPHDVVQNTNQSGYMPPVSTAYSVPVPKPSKEKQPMTRKKRAKIIAGTIVGVLLAACLVLGALFLSGSAFKVYKAMQAQDYMTAVSEYLTGVEGNTLQKAFLKMLFDGSKEDVLQKFKNGDLDYDTAYSVLGTLQSIGFGDMTDALAELTALHDADEAFEKGNAYYQAGDYANAAKEYAKIPESSDKYQEVSEKRSDALVKYKNEALKEAQALFEKEDYVGALNTLNEVRQLLENDSEVENAYSDYAAVYEKDCLNQADVYVRDNDYDRAISVLEHGLEVLPENSALTDKLNEIQTNKPIKLTDTNILYDGDRYELFTSSGSESFDMGSQTYHEGFTLRGRDSYALFDLGGAYTKMSFTVGRVNDGHIYDATVQIYLNNKITETYPLSGEGALQTITVNLAYAQTMKIQLVTDVINTTYGFANVYLEK